MKAKKITYSRLISKGNFENAKIGIELSVEKGERATDVFREAKRFVDDLVGIEKISEYEITKAHNIIKDSRNQTLGNIEDAQALLQSIVPHDDDDLPF